MTRLLIGVALGFYLGATLYHRIPHYIGLALADQPATPVGWQPKVHQYKNGKRVQDGS